MHDLKKTIQAVLFASAQKLELERIAKICKTTEEKALTELEKWKKELDETSNPTMLVKEDTTWRLTIREKFIPTVRKIIRKTELPKSILETLSIVAYKTPVLQSKVIKLRTNKAYDHLRYLEKAGFITREKCGRSKMLKLSSKFYEYFDTTPGKIKEKFKDKEELEKSIEAKEQEIKELNKPVETFDTVEIVDASEKKLETYTEKIGELEVYDEKKNKEIKKKIEKKEESKKDEKKEIKKKIEKEETDEQGKSEDEGKEIKEEEDEADKKEEKEAKEEEKDKKPETDEEKTEEKIEKDAAEFEKVEKGLEKVDEKVEKATKEDVEQIEEAEEKLEKTDKEKKEAKKETVEEQVEKDAAEIKDAEKDLEKAEEKVEKKAKKTSKPKFTGKGLYPKGMTPEMQKRVDKRVKEIVTGKEEGEKEE